MAYRTANRGSLVEAELTEVVGVSAAKFKPSLVADDSDSDDEFDDAPIAMATRDVQKKKIKRKFTDGFCLCVFSLYLIALAFILHYAYQHGEPARLTHGYNYKGQVCGLDVGVFDKEFTYWCAKKESINPADPLGPKIPAQLMDPICVSECPTGKGSNMCPGKLEIGPLEEKTTKGVTTQTQLIKRELEMVKDMKTVQVMNYYCLPEDTSKIADEIMGSASMKDGFKTTQTFLEAIADGKYYLLFFTFMAIAMGYTYLYVLSVMIKPLILVTFSLVDLSLFGFGIYFTLLYVPTTAKNLESHNYIIPVFGKEHATEIALGCSIASWILFLLFSIYWCLAKTAIDRTVEAIQTTFTIMRKMPTLLFAPAFQIFFQMICFAIMISGLFVVMSLGEVKTQNYIISALSDEQEKVQGIYRELTFTTKEKVALWLWGFGFMWTFEMCKAWNQFAVANAVVVFTLTNTAPMTPVMKGYWKGFKWHLGSIAFGAFIMGLVDICSFAVDFIMKQMKDEEGKINKTVKACACVCKCCLACLKKIVMVTNQLAYADVVIHGHGYLKACKNVMKTYISDPISMSLVIGTTKYIKSAGILLISVAGTLFSYWIMKIRNGYFEGSMNGVQDPGLMDLAKGYSSTYAASVLGVTAASMLISISVAQSFMCTFDMLTDTIAYCSIQTEKDSGAYNRMT